MDTLSPRSHGALATETKGQNSWLHSGPHLRDAEGNLPANIPPEAKPYADQKAGLLPEYQKREVLPQGDELAHGLASSTAPSAGFPQPGTAALPSGELSADIPAQVKQIHDAKGGTTFNLKQGDLVGQPAYAVSVYPERSQILDHAPSQQELANYIHQNLDVLQDGKASIGTWFNKDDGKHYLDISATTPSLDEAMQLGKDKKQLAIFDLKNLQEIPVPKEGTNVPNVGAEKVVAGLTPEQLAASRDRISKAEGLPAVQKWAQEKMGSLSDEELAASKERVAAAKAKLKPTALAIAGPSAAASIDDSDPNDPNRELKSYGKLALNLLGAGAAGAAIRANPQSPLKAAAAKGAAWMLLGGKKSEWMKRMLSEGVEHADLGTVRTNAEKLLAGQLEKASTAMPNAKKLMKHFESGQADMGWYDEVHGELSKLFGKDADLMSKLLAVTSVNAGVKSNVTLALKAYLYSKMDRDLSTLGKGEGFLPAVTANFKRVLAGEPITGRKIDNFAKALMGDENAVVVDRWIMRAFGFTEHDAPTPHEYDVIETAIKELAQKQGVTPRQMQASIWFSVKNKAEAGKNRPDSPSFDKLLNKEFSVPPKKQPSMF